MLFSPDSPASYFIENGSNQRDLRASASQRACTRLPHSWGYTDWLLLEAIAYSRHTSASLPSPFSFPPPLHCAPRPHSSSLPHPTLPQAHATPAMLASLLVPCPRTLALLSSLLGTVLFKISSWLPPAGSLSGSAQLPLCQNDTPGRNSTHSCLFSPPV